MQDRQQHIEQILKEITTTLLYEGYALYPYRSSALKNKTPIPFGLIYPQQYARHNKYLNSNSQTECLLRASADAKLDITVRFLQLANVDDEWQATEREVKSETFFLKELLTHTKNISFTFPSDDLKLFSEIRGNVTMSVPAALEEQETFLLQVCVTNSTLVSDCISSHDILHYTFVSAHTILKLESGEFVSMQDPETRYKELVGQCNNLHTYPVLIDRKKSTMLSSPIILYDYPEINLDSKGDLFDGTEMEEALWLHLNVLTENEKYEIARGNKGIRSLLDKADAMSPAELIKLHDQLKRVD